MAKGRSWGTANDLYAASPEAYERKRSAELMADGAVTGRVDELKQKLADRQLWTREQSVTVLAEIAQAGEKDADRVRAVSELNAMHGYDAPRKVAMTDADGNDIPTMVHVVYASVSPR